uniref:Uncharacterized protein n=1 Tax=Ananas comosus var. bracteatus TaxID=296719 RepID=A0A6V7PK03_ANACO|nr:unnamed protein product [Ananas comosus var. bracteatus]
MTPCSCAGREFPHPEVPAGPVQGRCARLDRPQRPRVPCRLAGALFIYAFGWCIYGTAAAYNPSSWAIAAAQAAYVITRCGGDGWTGLSWAGLRDLWAFVRLSFASAIMLYLEIWYMMVLVVLTGHLDCIEIAVDSISIWCSRHVQYSNRSFLHTCPCKRMMAAAAAAAGACTTTAAAAAAAAAAS